MPYVAGPRWFPEGAGFQAGVRDRRFPVSDNPLRTTLRPGDIGRIVAAHGELYAAEHGFDVTFEGYVAEPLGAFAVRADPRERIWIADLPPDSAGHPRFGGCVAVVAGPDGRAQLRWFLVHPSARGTGLGRRLLMEAIAFAREQGYRGMELWTVSALEAAARLYRSSGFRLAESVPGRRWGVPVTEERYELDWS